MMKDMKIGDVRDFRNFMGAVIDKKAFAKIGEYLDHAKQHARVLQGGGAKGDKGYFIEPTLIQTEDPGYKTLCEEIFGPVVTAYVYPDGKWEETLAVIDRTSPYALTGAVFSRDRRGVMDAADRAATCGRQLLHQRQADRRRRRPAAIRRRARIGHQRQGGVEAESGSMGERADREGNVLAAARLQVSVHGRGVGRRDQRSAQAFPVSECGANTGLDSAEPRWRRKIVPITMAARDRNSLCQF